MCLAGKMLKYLKLNNFPVQVYMAPHLFYAVKFIKI